MSGLHSKEQKKERKKKKEKSLSEKLIFAASSKDAENVALCLCTVPTLIPVK